MNHINAAGSEASHVVVLPRAGRLSGALVALLLLGVAAGQFGIFRAGSFHDILVTMFGTPFIIVALLIGLRISWLCARHDLIRVSDDEVILERRLVSIALSDTVVIDRHRLSEVVVQESEVMAKGHKYLIRSAVFLNGDAELGRTLPLSPKSALRLTEVSRGWALGSSERTVSAAL
jgi:hypothetical protein